MTLNDKKMREVFHLLFLENLLRISNPKLYVLKGGINLRFFFKSPRFSEDMDLDVLGGSVETLKKNGYKILKSASFQRALLVHGISNILINDPKKAKQTSTTQRFRVRLVNTAGEEFPTKIEFSRRTQEAPTVVEYIDPDISSFYKRLTFRCQHYSGHGVVQQKIQALVYRNETQARDVFDLYLLFLSGYFKKSERQVSKDLLNTACERVKTISYNQYRDQVEEYLSEESKNEFCGQKNWKLLQACILDELK